MITDVNGRINGAELKKLMFQILFTLDKNLDSKKRKKYVAEEF
jgi:hypothetical protein